MAHTAVASASSDDGEDIGARLSKLNLPSKPLIMDRIPDPRGRHCRHSEADRCWCYEYTTLLFRPEYEGKWLPDSPEPPETKVLVNGFSKRGGDDDGGAMGSGGGGGSRGGSGGGSRGGSAAAVTNGVTKVTGEKRFSLGQYKDRKLAGKTPAKTNPPTATAIATSKNSPITTGDKKSKEGSVDSQETVRNSREARRSPSRDEPPPHRRRQRTLSPLRTLLPPPAPATPNLPPLPPLLSPTLPQAIEEALLLEDNRSRGVTRDDGYESSIALSSRKGQRAPSDTEKPGRKTVVPGKKLPSSSTNTPSSRSPHQTNVSPTKAPSNKTIFRGGLGGNTTPKSVASKTVQKRPASPKQSSPLPKSLKTASKYLPVPTPSIVPEKKSLIVRIKYPKRRAKDVVTLMLLRPNPKRPHSEDHHLPAPAAKRLKADSLVVSAASGRSPAFKSPALKVQKERDITTPPKKINGHPNTTALKRTGSEGHAQTPSKDERNGISRKPLDSSAQSRVEGFRAEYQKYAEWGKLSKYEADATFKNQTETLPNKEKTRHATVVAVDSVLCYILSFICEEEAKALEHRSPPIDTWRSIVPLAKFVAEKSIVYAPLHGLCKQLEATIRQHLFDMEIAAYEKLPLPDTISKAPTPDSGTNGSSNDRTAYLRYKSSIIKESRELKDCWLDGMRYLTHDDIQSQFPRTFAQRSKKFVDPANVTPKVGKYKHPYQLPLHRNTTMIEALNFGYLFLQEWAAAEGIPFQSRLATCL